MCDPFAMQAIGAAVEYGEKAQRAQTQNERARQNYLNQVTQSNIASLQEHTAASDQLFRDSIKSLEAQRETEAAAESFGGSVVARLVRNKKAVEGQNKLNIETNFDNTVQQRQYELAGLQTQANGRLTTGPSLLATGLEIGNAYYTVGDGQYENAPTYSIS